MKEGICSDYAGFLEDDDSEKAKQKYEEMCESGKDDGICYRCKRGYTLDETTHECISNCKEYIEPSPFCEYCEHGYILIEGKKTC